MIDNLPLIDAPAGLLERIVNRLYKEQNLLAVKQRLAVFGVAALISAVVLVPIVNLVRADFYHSGFWQFSSLLFSDWQVISAYWQSFGLALLEALPVMSLVILLAALLVFLESLKFLAKNLKTFLTLKHLYGQRQT
jgi:hypothetical protein